MHGLNIVVIVVVVTMQGMDLKVLDHHQQELKNHYNHLTHIAQFKCNRPQPRVISMYEYFPKEETVNKAFFPDVTVIHLCDDAAGCCPQNHLCRPKHTHQLNLPFKITFLERMGKHKKGSWVIEYYTFYNHTECACLEASVCHPAPTEDGNVDGVDSRSLIWPPLVLIVTWK